MRNTILMGLIPLLFLACPNNSTKQPLTNPTDAKPITSFSNVIKIPKGFKKLAEVNGDLDKDGIDEKVFVFDTPRIGDFGSEREVRIYLKGQKTWKLWKKSKTAILPSEHGGIMGDPFESLSIERGSIVIKHFGGSRQKWYYTHRFRYQRDEWQLIGATINNVDNCISTEAVDYNLSTGKINYAFVPDKCEGEPQQPNLKEIKKQFTKKFNIRPEISSFTPGENEIEISDLEQTMYY